MSKNDWSGHELLGLVAGIAEHDPLVSDPLLRRALPFGRRGIHSLADVPRLSGKLIRNENLIRMKDVVVVHVTNLANRLTHDFLVIKLGAGCNFTGNGHTVALD